MALFPCSPRFVTPQPIFVVSRIWIVTAYYFELTDICCQVKQLLVSDGRLHLDFEIASTGSSQNYTRSYYMNGRDYIISGSSDEHVVRICCSQTGRRLRDISLEVNLDLHVGNAICITLIWETS